MPRMIWGALLMSASAAWATSDAGIEYEHWTSCVAVDDGFSLRSQADGGNPIAFPEAAEVAGRESLGFRVTAHFLWDEDDLPSPADLLIRDRTDQWRILSRVDTQCDPAVCNQFHMETSFDGAFVIEDDLTVQIAHTAEDPDLTMISVCVLAVFEPLRPDRVPAPAAAGDDDCAFTPGRSDTPWAPLGAALLLLGALRRRSPR